MRIRKSQRCAGISQSQIRAMTRECQRVEGINMAQGICDLDVPDCVIAGARDAMDAGANIYTAPEGTPELREAVAAKLSRTHGLDLNPNSEIMISAGATGAFYAVCLALLDPGDEVILFEPYYGYHVSTLHSLGCVPRYVRLQAPDWHLAPAALSDAITPATRAIVVNTPANPSGKVFSLEELNVIAEVAQAHDLAVLTDEIYEHFVYDGRSHVPPVSVPALADRTITISGLSKVFSITGWRLGYAVGPADVIGPATHLNDMVYVCGPSPLQLGAARGLNELSPDYYRAISDEHEVKRDQFCEVLTSVGLTPHVPEGAYYVLADIAELPGGDDHARAMHILERTGVASVPGRAFFADDAGVGLTRFCFAKKQEVLDEACERILRGLRG